MGGILAARTGETGRRSFLFLFIFVAILGVAQNLFGDCTACWVLRGIKVKLKNGEIKNGYVPWNEIWYQGRKGPAFPRALIDPDLKTLVLYVTLQPIKYPSTTIILSPEDIDTVAISEISDILPDSGIYDGKKGAGKIPVKSKKIIKLLQNEPVTAYSFDDGELAVVHLLSYNPNFGKKRLEKISQEEWYKSIEELEKKKVIVLRFSYD